MPDFKPQNLRNTAWAFATAGEPPPALLNPVSVLDLMELQGSKPVLASVCGLKSLNRCSATLDTAVNSCRSGWPLVAKAHAVLASSCALKSAMRRSDALANLLNNYEPVSPAVAKAHAVLASSCVMKSTMRCSAALANVVNSYGSG